MRSAKLLNDLTQGAIKDIHKGSKRYFDNSQNEVVKYEEDDTNVGGDVLIPVAGKKDFN